MLKDSFHSRKLRVCLVFPRFKYISGDPPLGIAYIAAYLKEKLPDVDVSIIDTTFSKENSFNKLIEKEEIKLYG